MKKLLLFLAAIAIICVLFLMRPATGQSSDKFDGVCTGHETAGRCADKCANPSDTLLGYDPQTGAAQCQAQPQVLPDSTSDVTPPVYSSFTGK